MRHRAIYERFSMAKWSAKGFFEKKTENFTISTPMARGLVLQNGLIERGDRTRNDF